jgi:hypothetical protein
MVGVGSHGVSRHATKLASLRLNRLRRRIERCAGGRTSGLRKGLKSAVGREVEGARFPRLCPGLSETS